MFLEIERATPADATRLAGVFQAAFSDEFNRQMFPATAEVGDWLAKNLLNGNGDAPPRQVILKIADSAGTGELVGFAKWIMPGTAEDAARADQDGDKAPEWPIGSDGDLCERFFGGMRANHVRIMGDRPHYYLDILGVHPSHQGQGIAGKLLKWGLAAADKEQVEVYLSSSAAGKRLYEKNGFQALESVSPHPTKMQWNMVRPVQTQ